MKPRKPTEDDIAYWGGNCTIGPMQGDHVGAENIEVLKEVVNGVMLIRVPWVTDERDSSILGGGTIWTTFWGGMIPTDVLILSDRQQLLETANVFTTEDPDRPGYNLFGDKMREEVPE